MQGPSRIPVGQLVISRPCKRDLHLLISFTECRQWGIPVSVTWNASTSTKIQLQALTSATTSPPLWAHRIHGPWSPQEQASHQTGTTICCCSYSASQIFIKCSIVILLVLSHLSQVACKSFKIFQTSRWPRWPDFHFSWSPTTLRLENRAKSPWSPWRQFFANPGLKLELQAAAQLKPRSMVFGLWLG